MIIRIHTTQLEFKVLRHICRSRPNAEVLKKRIEEFKEGTKFTDDREGAEKIPVVDWKMVVHAAVVAEMEKILEK